MQVFIDRIKGKAFVKQNGEVSEVAISKYALTPDPIPEPEDTKAKELAEALATLKAKIIDAKEKAELVKLGIETQSELDRKTAEYKAAKETYEDLKGC